MESLKNKWSLPLSILGGVALGAGVTLGVQSLENSTLKSQYEHVYESDFACLKNTPFDSADGALISINYLRQANEDLVSVTPIHANYYKPSVLFFVAGNDKLYPADHFTASFLVQSHCQNVPNGT